MARTHPIQRFGTMGGIQEVNPNDRDWQKYLGLGYRGIRALVQRRWPSTTQAAAAATITSLTPNTIARGTGTTSVAVVGTGFVVGQTVFSANGVLLGGAGATSATAATIAIPIDAAGVLVVRAINAGRAPSAGTNFTVT